MILNGQEIKESLDKRYIINALYENINSGSLDLRLSNEFKILKKSDKEIDLTVKEKPEYQTVFKEDGEKFLFTPGMCVLASTIEEFNLPDFLCTDIRLRSSIARCFINHEFASWADAGFFGSNLTLEFKNDSLNTYLIAPGMKLVQLIFYKMNSVNDEYNYRFKGRYNGVPGTIGSQGV